MADIHLLVFLFVPLIIGSSDHIRSGLGVSGRSNSSRGAGIGLIAMPSSRTPLNGLCVLAGLDWRDRRP